MKRGWIGFGLLLLILTAGVLSAWAMVQWHSPLEQQMELAAQYALSSDWEQAQQLTRQVSEQWEKRWHPSAVFADHEPMEEIDALFAQLEVYEENREALGFVALCAELARELGAMGEAHVPNWWNLL